MQSSMLKLLRKKQKQDYDRRDLSKTETKVDVIVLLKKNEGFDRKYGKFPQKWLGPYTVINISDVLILTEILLLTEGIGSFKNWAIWEGSNLFW